MTCAGCSQEIRVSKVSVIGLTLDIHQCGCAPKEDVPNHEAVARRYLRESRLTERMLAESMDDFQVNEKNRAAHALWKRWSDSLPDYVIARKSLLLWGPIGSGKTKMAADLFKGILNDGLPGVYYSSADIKVKLMDCVFKEDKLTRFVEHLKRVPVLFLDDLGASSIHEKFDGFWYSVINTRYDNKKTTLVTTHLNADDLARVLSPEVASRLYAMCKGNIACTNDETDRRLV